MEDTAIILARVVEQLSAIQQRLTDIEQDVKSGLAQGTEIAVLKAKLDQQAGEIVQLRERLTKDFVKQDAFRPLQKIVYGAVALMLTSIGTLILSLLKVSH